MLKVKNLVKIYKIGKTKETVKALNNVSIDFPDTGLVFLLGKSGSGKSTLLNAIGGLDTFDSGEIIIKGKSSKEFSQADFDSYRNTFIGFIFQEYNILEEFTVAKNLSIALELQGKKADKEEVNKLLEQVDMLEYAKRKPNQLSGGQKQRVAIARALIKNPEIIMADEPTGALDSNTGKQVMETLKKLSKEKLVVIVSHDREFAEIYGDRIVELKDGKIIQDVTKKEVEPTKTASGVSLIDDKIIHIKKGIELTNDDVNKITAILKNQTSKSDVIISIDDTANEQVKKANFITSDGNKETFCPTGPEDVQQKTYDPNKFKLIKSQLKFKDSLKMGASALKNKVAKLVFTIILSFVAFAMFGIIDTLSSFNRAEGVFNTIQMTGTKHISIKKESEGEYSNYTQPFKSADLNALKEKFPDVKFEIVAGRNLDFGSTSSYNNNNIQIDGLDSYSNNPVYSAKHSGMIAITEEKLQNLGFELVAGRLPNGNKEICISEHLYNCFKTNNSDDVTDYSTFLNKYSNASLYSNNGGSSSYKIVGIIKDDTDISKYTNLTTEEINANYALRSEVDIVFGFGFSNMCYVTQEKYDDLVSQAVNVSLAVTPIENSWWSATVGSQIQQFSDFESSYHETWQFNDFNNWYFTLENDEDAITSLNDYYVPGEDEVILDNNDFYSIYNDYVNRNNIQNPSEELKQTLLNDGSLKVYLRKSTDKNDPVEKVLTVVGYQTYNYDVVVGHDSLNASLFDGYEGQYYAFATQTEDGYLFDFPDEFANIKELFLKMYSIDLYLTHFKGVADPSTISYDEITLSGTDAIVSKDYFSQVGTDEELAEKIENGTLKLPIKNGNSSNAEILCELTVVGLTSDWGSIMVSDSLYNEKFKSFTEGYEYLIATLSDDEKQNRDFVKYCETYHDGIVFPVQNASTSILDQFSDIFKTLTEVFFYVGIGFAVFAALLLMNFISTSISYKKREIGILRALGARGSDVFGIFFKESLIIALINFVLATITTGVTCLIINSVVMNKLGLSLVLLSMGIRQVALMLGISVLVAFLSSLIPVSKISRKKPIDAINNR